MHTCGVEAASVDGEAVDFHDPQIKRAVSCIVVEVLNVRKKKNEIVHVALHRITIFIKRDKVLAIVRIVIIDELRTLPQVTNESHKQILRNDELNFILGGSSGLSLLLNRKKLVPKVRNPFKVKSRSLTYYCLHQ